MGSKKKSKSASVPAPPPPQNSIFKEDGFTIGQNIYDPAQNAYINEVFSTPFEKQMETDAQGLYDSVLPQLQDTSGEREAALNKYEQTLYDRFKQPLDREKSNAELATRENFNNLGMLNSTGYEDYRKKNIDEVYSQGLQNATNQAYLGRTDLANNEQNRLMQMLALATGQLSADQQNNYQISDINRAGSTSASDVMNQNYANQLAAAQYKNMTNMQNRGYGGLFGGLF